MWVAVFLTLALAALGSTIVRVFLAIRASTPQDRERHVEWAAISGGAVAVFAIATSLVRGVGRRRAESRWAQQNRAGRSSQEAAMLAALTS